MASRCTASDAGTHLADVELNQLEDVILGKVQQRVPTRMCEDTFIAKSFRYFDLDNSGWIDFPKFKRAFAPFTVGIMDQDLRLVFDRYAPEGQLHVKTFAQEFVRGSRREQASARGSAASEAWEGPEEVLLRMKGFLCGLGPGAIINLASAFREIDPENARVISHEAFSDILAERFTPDGGCPLQPAQVGHIFQLFQQPFAPGQIAYDEFLQAFKDDPLSQDRREVIRAAFRSLDTNSEGLVDVNNIFQAFNAARHPQVSDGSRSQEEVLSEFSTTFEECVAFRRGQRAYPSSLVAWEEFEDYYKFISGCFVSDEQFCMTMQRVWNLDKVPNQTIEAREILARPAAGIPAKSRTGLHHWQSNTLPANKSHLHMENTLDIEGVLQKARRMIASKGMLAAVDVVKNFYAVDDDVDDLLDIYEFRQACQQSGIGLREAEEAAIFQTVGVDAPSKGQRRGKLIHLQRFLRMLHGPVPQHRLDTIDAAFRALGGIPEDEESVVSPAVLKENFAADAHPMVVKGEMNPGVVMADFLDSFSLLAHIRGGCQSGMVSFADFLAYYDVVSSTVESDALFDLLMHRLWPITGEAPQARGGAEGDSPTRAEPFSPSKRADKELDRAIPRHKPPLHDGPSNYARQMTAAPREDSPVRDSHRRFSRGAQPVPAEESSAIAGYVGFSPLTRSQIVFNEHVPGELGVVIGRLRDSVAKRGLKGWRLLRERFEQHDHRRNGSVMRLDWQRVHRGMGLGLSPEDQEVLFKGYSAGRRDGAMDFVACLRQLRGSLSERRACLVASLFEALSEGGEVPVDKLARRLDTSGMPAVLVGSKDAASERQDFCALVEQLARGGPALDSDGFAELFTMVASLYKEEDEFRMMTTTAFGLAAAGVAKGGC